MADYTLRIRRYSPETGEAPYWEEFGVDLDGHRSVLDGILQAKDREDASIGIRCSCRAAICGSCGVRINGKPGLACHMHLDKAAENARDGVITVEPMGNMPVLKDLIVDMDAVHWKKIQRVTPWLLPAGEAPEREYIVPPESMIDVTQTMACIQCGACVSDCLSMGSTPSSSAPPHSRSPTASSATRVTPSSSSASRTSPRTRTASTTARTASTASRPARRASPR
jgi:succinate dehydrogenase / fumarate reductase iron-sulfur subunit